MDRKTAKELKFSFDQLMSERCPEFEVTEDDQARQFGRVYKSKLDCGINVFVLLLLSRNDNRFTVEMAWSDDSAFPLSLPIKTPIDQPQFDLKREHPSDGKFRFRLPGLFHSKGEYWWSTTPKDDLALWPAVSVSDRKFDRSELYIESSVGDAVEAIHRYGLPFVEQEIGKSNKQRLQD